MASFFRNAFDNFLNNISSTISTTISRNTAAPYQDTRTASQTRNPPSNSRIPADANISSSSTASQRNRFCDCCSATHTITPDDQHRPNYQKRRSQQQQSDSAMAAPKRIKIEDLRDLSDIDSLNTQQLKTILYENRIDYRNIIEKEELRAKTRMLWWDLMARKEKQKARLRNSTCDSIDDGIEDKKLCKICMEREKDTVLLECGHLLSCLDCGKKLSDCPICRCLVTRCIRVFEV